MDESQVLGMINDRLAKLESLPAQVAGLQADMRNLQAGLDRQDAAAGKRVDDVERRLMVLEKQMGAINMERPVAVRLADVERSLGLLSKISWVIAASVLAQIGKPLLEFIVRALQ